MKDWTDEQIWALRRGGHDPHKVYSAFQRAATTEGQPTVIVKTVKGYGMGDAGEGLNISHQQKKMAEDQLRAFRDRFEIPIADDQVGDAPLIALSNDQREYLAQRRAALGGDFQRKWRDAPPCPLRRWRISARS